MQNRKKLNDKIVDWIINRAKTEFADDIELVSVYGSHVNGTAGSKSDVDCYFIPKTERGYGFAAGFIIKNVGYDIFPVSWSRLEEIADLEDNLTPLVGDARVVFCSGANEAERFKALRQRLNSNLLNDEYVKRIAVERCEKAGKLCDIINVSRSEKEIRKLAGAVIMTVADAVAVYNHGYFHYGLKKQFEDLQNAIPNVPSAIISGYEKVIESTCAEEVKARTVQLFNDACEYLNYAYKPQEVTLCSETNTYRTDAAGLASLYEEIISAFNKIYVCCDVGNYILAYLSAVCLQRDLDEAQFIGCPEYDLLSGFNYAKLGTFYANVKAAENDLKAFIARNGGRIKNYRSFKRFESAKL